jgi:hypothetical protein
MTPSANSHLRAGGHNVPYLPGGMPRGMPLPVLTKAGSPLSPVESILSDLPRRKSFVPYTYEKHRDGGIYPSDLRDIATGSDPGHASFRRPVRTNPSRPLHSSHLGCKIPSGPSKALETSPLFVVSNQMSGLTLPVVLTDPGFQGLYLQTLSQKRRLARKAPRV